VPVEPLALAEPGDRAGRRIPAGDRLDRREVVSIVAGSTPGARAASRLPVEPTRAARTASGGTGARRRRSALARSTADDPMIAYWNGDRPRQAAAGGAARRLDEGPRRLQAATEIPTYARRWAAASPTTASGASQSSGTAATRRSRSAFRRAERGARPPPRSTRRTEQHMSASRSTWGRRAWRPGRARLVDVERGAWSISHGRPCQTRRFGFLGERPGSSRGRRAHTTDAPSRDPGSRRRPG